ncbi:class I SAM-dependent rRNA methyltransferase [Roseicella frigidaeris]|uniref:RlmI/RlmK family 23S rRNA methyltransferase n=1 Tax=Roseicella frigidaeris TaxID=2230885 RepID=A0A327MEM5_9PROT|nr:class I SAM-dependent rRNA methyltransferase [Roseicella frigidaeris]RAI58638.1 RlmI/RlmK family 23S rRNA methyltransferase [Roseicella frigidaeris]
MSSTPAISPGDRPLIRLLPGHDRRVKAGHPWAFSNEIAMTPAIRALPPGGAVRLEGDDGWRHGCWSFNPHSLIAARRLDRDPDAALDAAWAERRLGAALALRERLYDTPFYRLVHAEADGLPGLVIDRYGDALALQANTAGMEALTPVLIEALRRLLAPRLVVARNDAAVRQLEGLEERVAPLLGSETTARVEEGGLGFAVDLLGGQKTGWFYDQRENRDRVARLAPGATVLDAFCHTGGFGLRCAAAGAARVTLLDRSAPALDLAMETARGNGLAERVEAQRGEALEALERMGAAGTRFDIVVADPPAFAKSRKDQPQALRGYGKLARLAAALVAPGGFLFIASCSHHVAPGDFADAVIWGLGRARREAKLLFQGGAGPDHPVHPQLPESAYLKALLVQLA